jgi:pimeloyl-ACP methyl ester carboxylesterase
MRKLWVVGALALGAVACEEPTQPPSPEYVVAAFDPSAVPPVVPTPNDLAINPKTGLVEAPVDPSAPLAQQEFTRDYLNTLDGFPVTAVASTRVDGLDPSTLGPKGVLLLDLKPGAGQPVAPELDYDEEKGLLTLTPPRSGWPKGGHFAVAVIGGANGVKGLGGKEVVASPAWYLLRFPTPLVECTPGAERTPANCRPTTNLIPSTQQDVLARRREQAATALRLEELRVRYAPVLDSLEAQGIPRKDVALLWTFRVVSLPEVTFDPQRNVIPFPNDLLLTRDATTGATRVNLPMPLSTAPAEQKALVEGLNTLDGFSTTAPIVSENSDTLGAIDVGRLDASLLTASSRFVKVTARGAVPQSNVEVCLNCASSKRADGSVATGNPSQLQFVPRLPLEEKSTYAVALTTGLKNEQGQRVVPAAAFALLRSSAELVDASGKSLVSGVLDAQAQQLEKGRKAMKPLVDGLVAGGIARKDLLLSWAFTTQSTVSTSRQLHALPATLGAELTDSSLYLDEVTDDIKVRMGTLPKDQIGKVFSGSLVVPYALNGPNGTLRLNHPRYDRIPFMLVLPLAAPASAAGYPVTLYGHGLRGNHRHMLAMANALAGAGRAVIAIDTVKHGERSVCVGSAFLFAGMSPNPTDDLACANPTTQQCETETANPSYGRCVARLNTPGAVRNACDSSQLDADRACAAAGQGRCRSDNKCEGGTFRTNADGAVTISGWNMLDLQNFFVTRDNFRQQVIDLAQVARVVQGEGLDAQLVAQGASPLDGTRIDYVGQSLGGILGTLYTAVSPDVHRAVLNVPGGRLTQLMDESEDNNFKAMRNALYTTLAARQMPQGSPAFDTFFWTTQWILDPADPVNSSWFIRNGSGVPADRDALVQYITGDKVTPNTSTRALIDAANLRPGARPLTVHEYNPTATELPGDARHGFLTNFANADISTGAQEEAVQFLTK